MLAANFGGESAEEKYTFILLIKTLGAIYSSVNHAVLAQEELGRGIRQDIMESIVSFLDGLQDVFTQAYGPAVGWSAHHRSNLVEAVVKDVSNRKLSDLIATYQIPSPFSFVGFRVVVVQYLQRIPNIVPNKLEVNAVGNGVEMNACFACRKVSHLARDCAIKHEPPTYYHCNV